MPDFLVNLNKNATSGTTAIGKTYGRKNINRLRQSSGHGFARLLIGQMQEFD
jgi:hypothetical protein